MIDREKLEREACRLGRSLNFWTRLARVTRFGIHGFVLWRIRKLAQSAIAFNQRADALNRRERKERKRELAISRGRRAE